MQFKLLGIAMVALSIATACSESSQPMFEIVDGSDEEVLANSDPVPSESTPTNDEAGSSEEVVVDSDPTPGESTLTNDETGSSEEVMVDSGPIPDESTLTNDETGSSEEVMVDSGPIPDESTLTNEETGSSEEVMVDSGPIPDESTLTNDETDSSEEVVVDSDPTPGESTLTNEETDSSEEVVVDSDPTPGESTLTNDETGSSEEVMVDSGPIPDESTLTNDETNSSEEVVIDNSDPTPDESTSMDDGTDPGNIPQYAVEVEIPSISLSNAPTIDGFYDAVYNDAVFVDRNLERLSINSLMIDQGAIRQDGAVWPEFELRWYALHDDVNLYVFVEGEKLSISSPTRDSTNVWEDDSINLFFDGNNSKGSSYDQVDDRHLMIPLLTSPDDLSANSTVVVQGPNSAPIPGLEFKACVCKSETGGQYTWEIKVPLSDFGITRGVAFGFDIQMDLDHDGEARDARWAWFHPSRTTVDVNNTVTNPSFMGTVVIK